MLGIKNSNKVIRLDSYIHRHFSFIPTIADFHRLENTERNELAPKTNQLVPAEINVC